MCWILVVIMFIYVLFGYLLNMRKEILGVFFVNRYEDFIKWYEKGGLGWKGRSWKWIWFWLGEGMNFNI